MIPERDLANDYSFHDLEEGHHAAMAEGKRGDIVQRLLAIRGKDYEHLNVVELTDEGVLNRRSDMNRLTLLTECRRLAGSAAALSKAPAATPARNEQGTPPATKTGRKEVGGAAEPRLLGLHRTPMKEREKKVRGGGGDAGKVGVAGGRQGLAIQLRDIRYVQNISDPALFVRWGAIVIAMGPFRAVITSKSVFLLSPPDRPLGLFIERQKHLSRDGPDDEGSKLPFELSVLEAILVLAIQGYVSEVARSQAMLRALLKALRADITAELLNEAYSLKAKVGRAQVQVEGAKEALEKVQADDVAMQLMPLTAIRRRKGATAKRADVDEVEILLDTYEIEVESLATKLNLLLKEIESSEHVLNLRLENIQKNTFLANAFFHMILAVLGVPTCVAGWFGTNFWSGQKFNLAGPSNGPVNFTAPDFPNERYDSDPTIGVSWVFLWSSVGVCVICFLVCCGITTYIRRKGLTHMSAGA